MPKVSVIVPIYNHEIYLKRCIDSILRQTFSDFELILVDDGSTDKSGAICDEYKIKDSRVKVIHKPNGGLSSARNAGLDAAGEDLIMFVDSDDYVADNIIEGLLAKMTDDVDMVFSELKVADRICTQEERQYTVPRLLSAYAAGVIPVMNFHCAFAKLYRNRIIKESGLRYNEDLRYGEDLHFNLMYIDKCKKILSLHESYYMYTVENPDSLSSRIRAYTYDDQKKIFALARRLVGKHCGENDVRNLDKLIVCVSLKIPVQAVYGGDRQMGMYILNRMAEDESFTGMIGAVKHLPKFYWMAWLIKKKKIKLVCCILIAWDLFRRK